MRPIALAISIAGLLVASAPSAPAAGTDVAVPAAIPPAAADRAERSLERFARGWMQKLARAEANNRRSPVRGALGATYRGYSSAFTTELKPTGRPEVPFVGLIRYKEHLYRCADAAPRRCRSVSTVPVTEIFRFQDGRWVY